MILWTRAIGFCFLFCFGFFFWGGLGFVFVITRSFHSRQQSYALIVCAAVGGHNVNGDDTLNDNLKHAVPLCVWVVATIIFIYLGVRSTQGR